MLSLYGEYNKTESKEIYFPQINLSNISNLVWMVHTHIIITRNFPTFRDFPQLIQGDPPDYLNRENIVFCNQGVTQAQSSGKVLYNNGIYQKYKKNNPQ